MNLDQLKDLIAQQDETQRRAADAVRPAYEKARQAAHELRESVSGTVDEDAQRERLQGIVVSAAGKIYASKSDLQMAGLVVGQHAAAVADQPGLDSSLARDGKWLIANAMSNVRYHRAEQRQKVVAALVVAASGAGVETGLIEFPQPWWSFPSLPNLEAMAELMDPEAVATMRGEQEEQAALLAEAMRLEDALKQAQPKLFAVGDSGTALTVAVRNHRGGSLTIMGVSFEPGDNELTAEQFSKVRGNRYFAAHTEAGALEIITTSDLVEEV
ncbi:hypothetical protein ACFQH5_11240 [Halomonas salifodinae]|uniref:Uncharacterized protein n=1 Tax=Halomonas salifodinae TaxID=438745 RepID=A0ABW2EYW8_9GAMM